MKKLKLDELNRPTLESYVQSDKLSIIVVLDNIRSMSNIGSVFRTCDAFMIEKIILCGITAQPPHREIYKTALGATESVVWEYFTDAQPVIDHLQGEKFQIISLEQTSTSLRLTDFTFNKTGRYAFVLGNEVDGVSGEFLHASDTIIEIPQHGIKHSLNVSVAAGIVLFDAYRQITATSL